ncbi:MAG: FliH/SctL family protein [Rhodoferax sp.]
MPRSSSSKFIPNESIDQVADWSFAAVDTHADRFAARVRAQEEQLAQERDIRLREEGFSQGYSEGFEKGYAQGVLEGEQKLQDYIAGQGHQASAAMADLYESVQAQLVAREQSMAQGVLELACDIARQVLCQELRANPDVLRPVVQEALGLLMQDSQSVRLRLHPLDADMLGAGLEQRFASASLQVVVDDSITPGGCVLESAGTVVDATVQRRWQRVVASLGLEQTWEPHDAGT